MVLHIYHCNMAVIRDYRSAPGRNRPDGTGRFPERPGMADVEYLPSTEFDRGADLARLLRLFQRIDLGDPEGPVRIDYDNLEVQLGLGRSAIRKLLHEAAALGLMSGLTIDYNHERWLHHTNEKGCLVIMTGVEETDLQRDRVECARAFCEAVDAVRDAIVNEDQELRDLFVVPNGHLVPRAGSGLPWKDALAMLQPLPDELRARGYRASLNSYGYAKLIQLAINAHKLGYVLRVV